MNILIPALFVAAAGRDLDLYRGAFSCPDRAATVFRINPDYTKGLLLASPENRVYTSLTGKEFSTFAVDLLQVVIEVGSVYAKDGSFHECCPQRATQFHR